VAAPARSAPARRAGRTAIGAATLAAALAGAGCGVLPGPPGPDPSPAPPPTVAPATPTALSPDGLSQVERAAVRVRNVACGGIGTGSGFALEAHLLVTNSHVVAGASVLQLDTYDGRDVEVAAAEAATIADLALVRTAQALPAVLPIAAADPRAGDPVSIVGYPGGGPLLTSTGAVLGYTDDALGANSVQVFATDAEVEPGSSGSAVVDTAGAVVGVVYARDDSGQSYAVPVSALRDLLAQPDSFRPLAGCD
jgi:S1-C subfamily serine protease